MTRSLSSTTVSNTKCTPERSAQSHHPALAEEMLSHRLTGKCSVIMEERFFLLYISLMIALVAILDLYEVFPKTRAESPPSAQQISQADDQPLANALLLQRFPIEDLLNRETSTINDATLQALLQLLKYHDLQMIIRITSPTPTLRQALAMARTLRASIPTTTALRELVLIRVKEGPKEEVSAQLITAPPPLFPLSTTAPS